MELENVVEPLNSWFKKDKKFIIAGPCSAETPEQLMTTAKEIAKIGKVDYLRAGIWKPRTRPNAFEGKGVEALKWIEEVKKETGLPFATEVANALHVEVALKYGVDLLWIGARSTVSPFVVQEIADALKGTDIPVFVKNPINPDNALWIGAFERLAGAGVKKIGAIHRGYSSFEKSKYRNVPNWQMAIEIKRKYPFIPLICDPSHIGGQRDMIFDISQRALDLDYDGLIIESHINPDEAWSDASQQVTPAVLATILNDLKIKSPTSSNVDFQVSLDELRAKIDNIDREILEALAQRMAIVDKIGEFKKENNVTTYQNSRWTEMFDARQSWAKGLNVEPNFAADLFKLIHTESVRKQEEIINALTES